MKTFSSWLKSRLPFLALFCVFFGLLALVFYLYSVPREAVNYGFALCGVIGVIFCAADFSRARRRHMELASIQRSLSALSVGELRPYGPIQEDYAGIIDALRQENSRLRADYAVRQEEMDDYYTLWAHQIKTPIAAMRLLLQTADESMNEKNKSELEAELFRTEQYVELAMGYQRLEGDGSDFVIAMHGLDDIVRQAVRKYAKEFIRRGLSLDYKPLNFAVLTDEKWLTFVVEQILSNALKYTHKGGISIYLRGGDTLVIADTGMGIAPEDLPRIFEKGFTGYNGRADKKSTGIGLYLCRRILAKLGHRVFAESRPGEGTRVCVKFSREKLVVE